MSWVLFRMSSCATVAMIEFNFFSMSALGGCDKRPSDAPPFKNGSCDVCISLHWVRDGATRLLLSGECRVRLLSPNRPRLVQTMLASSVTTLSNLSSGWLASKSFHKYSVALAEWRYWIICSFVERFISKRRACMHTFVLDDSMRSKTLQWINDIFWKYYSLLQYYVLYLYID